MSGYYMAGYYVGKVVIAVFYILIAAWLLKFIFKRKDIFLRRKNKNWKKKNN